MDKIVFLLGIIFLLGCKGGQQNLSDSDFSLVADLDKLETLLSMPQDSVYDHYDLSDNLLTNFPDLSGYTIRSLDLSHNNLDTIILSFLPKGLEKLDLSYNVFRVAHYDSINQVCDLNLSHNFLRSFSLDYFINRIDLSYNDLTWVRLFWAYTYYRSKYKYRNDNERGKMNYLNISDNSNLHRAVSFDPRKIDTIVRFNTANNEKLIEIGEYMSWAASHPNGAR